MPRAVFGFGEVRIRVDTEDDGHLRWLAEFLVPHFETTSDAEHDCAVTMVEDDDRYRDTLARGPARGTADAFAFDTRVVRVARWPSAAGELRYHDATAAAFYEVADGGRSIRLLTATDNPGRRKALMRVVREIATNRAQSRGGLLLHAAGLTVGGRAILVAGAKGSGKTTLLVHCLRLGSARYLANDRVMVARDRPIVARGVPTIVALRAGTLALFPALAGRLERARYDSSRRLDEPPATSRPRQDKATISPAQLCRLLGVAPAAQAEIAAVVFPRITDEEPGLGLERLSEHEALARLITQALFGVTSSRSSSEVFSLAHDGAGPSVAERHDRCRELAARVPAFECRLGTKAYESAETAEALVGRI